MAESLKTRLLRRRFNHVPAYRRTGGRIPKRFLSVHGVVLHLCRLGVTCGEPSTIACDEHVPSGSDVK